MKKILIVVDMQNDFINGTLGSTEAAGIVSKAADYIKNFDGDVIFTKDTHTDNYLSTSEGRNLPVVHCLKGTVGWELHSQLLPLAENKQIFEKSTFGSPEVAQYIASESYTDIELLGLCTDICVISNAMLIKAFVPEANITINSGCCAGVTPQSHSNALAAMASCQINIK